MAGRSTLRIQAADTELTEAGVEQNWRVMRLLACLVTALMYIWQEQIEFGFSATQLSVVTFGVVVLSCGLAVFVRGPSSVQPPKPIARSLRWLGRHTLEIYVIQLAGSEFIINQFSQVSCLNQPPKKKAVIS